MSEQHGTSTVSGIARLLVSFVISLLCAVTLCIAPGALVDEHTGSLAMCSMMMD